MKRLRAPLLAGAAGIAILVGAVTAVRRLAAAQEELSAAVGPDAAEKSAATRRADAIWNALRRRGTESAASRPATRPTGASGDR